MENIDNGKHQFADRFLSLGYQEGMLVEHSVFWDLFGLEEPRGMVDAEEHKKNMFRFMGMMDLLQRELLSLGYDLQNRWGEGYYLVPFQDRPRKLANDSLKMIRKGIREGQLRAESIRHPEQLVGESKRILDATIAKLGYLEAIRRRKV